MTARSEPLVSVVIPSYNHAHFIGRALQSVREQTYSNWEVFVVDNHSQDNTDEVARSFADPRIRLLKIHNDGVIAASRNMGARAAAGQWIAFLDSDDWWSKDKIRTCISQVDDGVDFVYHRLKIVGQYFSPFRRTTIKSWQLNAPVVVDLLVNGNPIANSSAMVRRSTLERIGWLDESREMVAAEDYNAWLRIALVTQAFVYVPETLGFYMVHGASISKKDMSLPTRAATVKFQHFLDNRARRKFESRLRLISAEFSLLSGDLGNASQDLLYCVRYGSIPVRLKSLIALVSSKLSK